MGKRTLRTKENLLWPIEATCGKCGGHARIYSNPLPYGTCVCLDGCSPVWLDSFMQFTTKQEGSV